MRVRIVSNGAGCGTSIVDAETGEPIDGVTAISWSVASAGDLAYATLTIEAVEVDVVGEALVAQ